MYYLKESLHHVQLLHLSKLILMMGRHYNQFIFGYCIMSTCKIMKNVINITIWIYVLARLAINRSVNKRFEAAPIFSLALLTCLKVSCGLILFIDACSFCLHHPLLLGFLLPPFALVALLLLLDVVSLYNLVLLSCFL